MNEGMHQKKGRRMQQEHKTDSEPLFFIGWWSQNRTLSIGPSYFSFIEVFLLVHFRNEWLFRFIQRVGGEGGGVGGGGGPLCQRSSRLSLTLVLLFFLCLFCVFHRQKAPAGLFPALPRRAPPPALGWALHRQHITAEQLLHPSVQMGESNQFNSD